MIPEELLNDLEIKMLLASKEERESHEVFREIVQYILSAVRDGSLDKALGVVGRGDLLWNSDRECLEVCREEWQATDSGLGCFPFIAFRPSQKKKRRQDTSQPQICVDISRYCPHCNSNGHYPSECPDVY